ncbi:MAG TPA: hypothetical protein VF267_08075 [Gammaproteobacteria bacterium]
MKSLPRLALAFAGLGAAIPAFADTIAVFEFPEGTPFQRLDALVVMHGDRYEFSSRYTGDGSAQFGITSGSVPGVSLFWLGTHADGVVPGTYTSVHVPAYVFDAVFPAVGGNVGIGEFGDCGSRANMTVHEAEYGGDDTIDSLAVDFELPCNALGESIRGSVRYNSSIPLSGLSRDVIIDTGLIGKPGEQVTLEALFANGFLPAPGSGSWTQIAGTEVAGMTTSGTAGEILAFTVPDVPRGGEIVMFEYRATDAAGNPASAIATATIINGSDPRNSVQLAGQPGEKMFDGKSIQLTEPWLDMRVYDDGFEAFEIHFYAGETWKAGLSTGTSGELVEGGFVYDESTAASTAPRFEISRPGALGLHVECDADSTFTTHVAEMDRYWISSLDLAFEQTCDGTTPTLSGRIVYSGAGSLDGAAKPDAGYRKPEADNGLSALLPARFRTIGIREVRQ